MLGASEKRTACGGSIGAHFQIINNFIYLHPSPSRLTKVAAKRAFYPDLLNL